MTTVEVVAVVGVSLAVLTAIGAFVRFLWRQTVRVVHFVDNLAKVMRASAVDSAAVRHELTRNGGTSTTKDITALAAQSAKEAAEAAKEASRHAEVTEGYAKRTEHLLRRHVENGEAIMEVGVHNDERLFLALAEKDILVTGLREYPPVYTGDDVEDLDE